MHKRTDADGETIITSAGFAEVDPESLVEPTEPTQEELEAEQEKLAVKVKFKFSYQSEDSAGDIEYEGTLHKIHYSSMMKEQKVTVFMGVENALELVKFASCSLLRLKGLVNLDYVWKHKHPALQAVTDSPRVWTVRDIIISDIENSVCLCCVFLERTV